MSSTAVTAIFFIIIGAIVAGLNYLKLRLIKGKENVKLSDVIKTYGGTKVDIDENPEAYHQTSNSYYIR